MPYAKGTPQGVLDDVLVIPYHDTVAAKQLLEGAADGLAAVLFDPVASRVGMLPPSADYLEMLAEFCAAHGVLLIFDEVIAFRLGIEGAQGVYGIAPDLTALGKIIGGGLPVGAVAGKRSVMEVFNGGGLPHGGTFNANPLTMVAGTATMQQMTQDAYAELNALGEFMRQAFHEAFAREGLAAQVTGQSSLARLHLTDRALTNYRSIYPHAEESERMTKLHRHWLEDGFYLSSYGLVCLSTVNTRAEVEALVDSTIRGLSD